MSHSPTSGPEARGKVTVPVSVVVPCYMRHRETADLLRSFAAASCNFELVIVDDGSPRPLEHVVAEFNTLDVRYIRNERNSGPAVSRNIGATYCRNDFIAFTDNDCIIDPGWLTHLFGSIANASLGVAGVGGRVLAHGSDLVSKYYDYHKILDPWYFRGKHYYLTTANAIFRRHVFELVGGFDETVRYAGGEDAGLCFKLQNAGYTLGYNPDAVVFHQYNPSVLAFMRTFYRYGYGCAGQSAKHFRSQEFKSVPGFAGRQLDEN